MRTWVGSLKKCPDKSSALVHTTTRGGLASAALAVDLIGLKITSGWETHLISSAMDGPIAFPIPQKNRPAFKRRSSSLRRRMLSSDWPASMPTLVQQKVTGRLMLVELTSVFIYIQYSFAMQNVRGQIRRYMKDKDLDQASLASAAGVSQATVSRALARDPLRRGEAYLRLLSYVRGRSKGRPLTGKNRVTKAFERIWDGSDVHAAVVARIIEDLGDLRPSQELRRRVEHRSRARGKASA